MVFEGGDHESGLNSDVSRLRSRSRSGQGHGKVKLKKTFKKGLFEGGKYNPGSVLTYRGQGQGEVKVRSN